MLYTWGKCRARGIPATDINFTQPQLTMQQIPITLAQYCAEKAQLTTLLEVTTIIAPSGAMRIDMVGSSPDPASDVLTKVERFAWFKHQYGCWFEEIQQWYARRSSQIHDAQIIKDLEELQLQLMEEATAPALA